MLALLMVGAAVNAAPASADQGIGTTFGSADGTVWGHVTFYDNGYTVKVDGSVYGLSTNPGYQAQATYFAGSTRVICKTTTRSNRVDGTVRNFSDTMACLTGNIHTVSINYYNNGYRHTQYLDNPWV